MWLLCFSVLMLLTSLVTLCIQVNSYLNVTSGTDS